MGVVEQVIVLEWLVGDGAAVAEGDPVVLLETDKAETELEAPVAGRIEIHVPVSDDEIPVGAVLATIHPGVS
jgi:pyruvate/2-oxoglutarate dehydrogenase complex dihydrolipoamide acyltransferase (E2) component